MLMPGKADKLVLTLRWDNPLDQKALLKDVLHGGKVVGDFKGSTVGVRHIEVSFRRRSVLGGHSIGWKLAFRKDATIENAQVRLRVNGAPWVLDPDPSGEEHTGTWEGTTIALPKAAS